MSEAISAAPTPAVPQKSPSFKRIIVLPADHGLSVAGFDEVFTGTLADIAGRYQLLLPADDLQHLPITANQLSLGFLCHEEYALMQLSSLNLQGDIVFQPSPATALDLLRRQRQTLVMTADRDAGHILSLADLHAEVGGSGIGVQWREAMVGRRLLYPVTSGQAMDFGYISEDFEGHRQ